MLDSLNLDGKTIIVTGGGTGLGREIVRALARAGADVVITARRQGPIDAAADEVRALGRRALAVSADLTVSAQVNAMVQRAIGEFGKVDVLVNNAGIVREESKPLWDVTDAEWREVLDGNLTSVFYCSRAVIKHMVDRGKGRIVNMSSGFGLRAKRDNYLYGTSKAGIIQFTRILALTYGGRGVTSACIVPGNMVTEAGEEFRGRAGFTAETASLANPYIPIGRAGAASEIGPLAVYLASDASEYLNGEIFTADGGSLAGGYAPTGHAPVIPLPEK
ncbi:MAG: SDR family oxidoreductase [Dehalococcoidia bacterium]|nr:SDR family oxidoreductase [Dehalococcoidia bacterium]